MDNELRKLNLPRLLSLLQHCVIYAEDTANSSARQHPLVAPIDSGVYPRNGNLVDQTTEGYALPVYDERDERLDNAEGQGINNGVKGRRGVTRDATVMRPGFHVDEIPGNAREDAAREGPEKSRGPERSGEQQEHVRDEDGVVAGAEKGDGRDGKGVSVCQNLGAQEVELEGGDGEEHGIDAGQGLARRVRGLGDARLLVNRRDAGPYGDGGAVDGIGNIGGCRGKGNTACQGQCAGGRVRDSCRHAAGFFFGTPARIVVVSDGGEATRARARLREGGFIPKGKREPTQQAVRSLRRPWSRDAW